MMGQDSLVPCDFCGTAIATEEFTRGKACVILKKRYCPACMQTAVQRGKSKNEASTPPPRPRRLTLGEHGCAPYASEEERRAQLAPYVREGLQKQQKVLYFLEQPTPERILSDFRNAGVSVQPYLQSGQLQILSSATVKDAAGRIDPLDISLRMALSVDRAIAQAWAGLRIVCDMSWALQSMGDQEQLVEFEMALATLTSGGRCAALCQYDVERFEPGLLHQIRKNHAFVLAKGMAVRVQPELAGA
jgi:hypothetical protein